MTKLSRSHLTVAAATAAAAVGGTAVATAADNSSSTATTTQQPGGGAAGETPLIGTVKERVQAAALAKVSGTVLRVETDNGGVYEAHIRKADGTEVEVKVDASFNVTAVNELSGHRRGGGHGRGPGDRADLAAVAKKLGVTEAKLRDAVATARPAARADRGAELAAELANALGVDASKVQAILDANRPQRWPGAGRPDESALVTALAKELSKREADVRAALDEVRQAHRADHTARETALFAAVAKALGKTTAEVKAAFEAARPSP